MASHPEPSHEAKGTRWLLFDGGDTVIWVFPEYSGPMYLWPRLEAVPGAATALATLHREWMIATATNAPDSGEPEIWAALRRVGLADYFDGVYCFRQIGYKKPAPEFYQYIIRDLGLDPGNLVMIGDDFEGDVMGAVRAGLRGLWFNPNSDERRQGPGYDTFHDFAQLPDLLTGLEELCQT